MMRKKHFKYILLFIPGELRQGHIGRIPESPIVLVTTNSLHTSSGLLDLDFKSTLKMKAK